MKKEKIDLFYGALLHDIGKVIQRATGERVKTTRENGWLALRLKASATGRDLKAYRMVSLQHHLC